MTKRIATTVGAVAVILLTIIGCCSNQEQYVRSYIHQYTMYDDIQVRRSNNNSKPTGEKKKKNCKVKLLLTKIGKAMQGALTAEITRKH